MVKVYAYHPEFPAVRLLLEDTDTGDVLQMHGFDVTAAVWHLAGGACACGDSDGTVDCACGTAMEFYDAALEWIDENDGEEFDDPGYFD